MINCGAGCTQALSVRATHKKLPRQFTTHRRLRLTIGLQKAKRANKKKKAEVSKVAPRRPACCCCWWTDKQQLLWKAASSLCHRLIMCRSTFIHSFIHPLTHSIYSSLSCGRPNTANVVAAAAAVATTGPTSQTCVVPGCVLTLRYNYCAPLPGTLFAGLICINIKDGC